MVYYATLKLIFWAIIGVLALSFFGISLREIITSPAGQANFAYLWELIVAGWNWVTSFVQSQTPTT